IRDFHVTGVQTCALPIWRTPMFREILVPIDLSDEPSWQKALTTAIGLCQAFGARLHAITVVPDFGLPIVGQYFPEGYMAKVREETAQQLHALLAAKAPDTDRKSVG